MIRFLISCFLFGILSFSTSAQERICSAYSKYGKELEKRVEAPPEAGVLNDALWQIGDTVDILFLNGEKDIQQKVEQVANEWTNHANLTFRFVSSGPADIRISFLNGGNWSYLGSYALDIIDSATMNLEIEKYELDSDEFKGIVLHEFGHAIGMVHEHQQPNAQIDWNKEKVYEYYMGPPDCWGKDEFDFNIFNKEDESNTSSSEFDPHSIMMYAVPKGLTNDGFYVDWNNDLSKMDKSFIQGQYPN